MGDWDDSEEEEEEVNVAPAAGGDPFGDEDVSSDEGGNWDDSEEEDAEPAKGKDSGTKKSTKEIAREKRQKDQAARRLALKAERMELAIRAGRGAKTEPSAAAPEPEQQGPIGPIGEDGFERRTDPSDGVGYTFLEYLDAYGQDGEHLWEVAGQMMLGKAGGLGAVQQDSDMLFGDEGDAGADGDAPSSDAVTLDEALKYDLLSKGEFDQAAAKLVQKFEQLIVSDNFAPFLGKWAAAVMEEAKPEKVQTLLSELTRAQNASKLERKSSQKSVGAAAPATAAATAEPAAAAAAVAKKKKKNFAKMTMGEEKPVGPAEDDFSESMDAFM
jgi:hypothetical protein